MTASTMRKHHLLSCVAVMMEISSWTGAFIVSPHGPHQRSTILQPKMKPFRESFQLAMAKSNNKQADLRRKLELAKRQNEEMTAPDKGSKLSDVEVRERNDRLRFEALLKREGSKVLNDYSSDGYLNKKQEEEEILAATAGSDRIFEGDPSPVDCFEELVGVKTENAIGRGGKERLVPWLGKGVAEPRDYLVILTDPRRQSPELRQTIQNVHAEIPADICRRLIVVNADSPAENRRWLKKSGMDGKLELYSDEKMAFMRAFTALGEKRLSMSMFIISDQRVQKIARDIDQYGATRTIRNAVKAMTEELRL